MKRNVQEIDVSRMTDEEVREFIDQHLRPRRIVVKVEDGGCLGTALLALFIVAVFLFTWLGMR